jgi:hypothetical protein
LWQTLLFKPWSLKIAHETPHVTVHEWKKRQTRVGTKSVYFTMWGAPTSGSIYRACNICWGPWCNELCKILTMSIELFRMKRWPKIACFQREAKLPLTLHSTTVHACNIT